MKLPSWESRFRESKWAEELVEESKKFELFPTLPQVNNT